jgi:cytochrome c oxidase subunit 1
MRNIITLEENNKKLAKLWLFQAVGALALSGFFAIFLVVARSPKIGELLPYKDFFKTTLTIHVNLSVLVWLTSLVCMIFATRTRNLRVGYFGLFLSAIGTVIIAGSIFDVSAEAYLNNYIPMLHSKVFELGIFVYFAGILIASMQAITIENDNLKSFFITSLFIILAAFITLLITHQNLNLEANRSLYNFADHYERLFWGFGHVLQFLYSSALIYALFAVLGIGDKNKKFIDFIFYINLAFAATGIYIVKNFDVTSFEYIDNFSKQMIYFAGVAPVLAAFIAIPAIIKNYVSLGDIKPQRNAIVWGAILFAAGGIISMFIKGVNTIIPAHYHGSIIGISLCLMAYVYHIMPRLGYGEVKGRMANIQPILYGSGQLLHIIGFAISGGYGAMRKTPGMELPAEANIYMGLMGLGGLISIIGGLFFVIVIFRLILKSWRK